MFAHGYEKRMNLNNLSLFITVTVLVVETTAEVFFFGYIFTTNFMFEVHHVFSALNFFDWYAEYSFG